MQRSKSLASRFVQSQFEKWPWRLHLLHSNAWPWGKCFSYTNVLPFRVLFVCVPTKAREPQDARLRGTAPGAHWGVGARHRGTPRGARVKYLAGPGARGHRQGTPGPRGVRDMYQRSDPFACCSVTSSFFCCFALTLCLLASSSTTSKMLTTHLPDTQTIRVVFDATTKQVQRLLALDNALYAWAEAWLHAWSAEGAKAGEQVDPRCVPASSPERIPLPPLLPLPAPPPLT